MNAIRTPINPRKTANYLLTTGTFATSRNPTYVGVLYLMLSVSLTSNSVYSLALLPLNFLVIRFGLVLPEERYLTERFGENYLKYMKKTPRWIGRRSKK